MRLVSLKSALVAATLAVGALTTSALVASTPAAAHGFGGHGGHFGHFRHFGHRWGWGPRFGGCVIDRTIDEDGEIIVRRECF